MCRLCSALERNHGRGRPILLVMLLVVMLLLAPATAAPAEPPRADREAIAAEVVESGQGFWERIATQEPYAIMSSRKLFSYALALCESRRHPERLGRLFELGTRVQDRDPKSPGYGNLKWTWRDERVTDANAIDFCAQDGLQIWLKHRDWVPEPARRLLEEWLRYAVEGCLRHHPPTSYTNIALLNSGNLIVLGEALGRPEVAEEGCRRLDAVCLWTWQFGTHEYCSPTYYGTDLNGLLFIEALAERPRARQQARALLELFWTDIALSWFPATQSLAGAHSRSYDYIRGLGGLDTHLWLAGWLKREMPAGSDLLYAAMGRWSPPARLREMNLKHLPRLVQQSWGLLPAESRTHMTYPDVTLSCCGAQYGKHDMPLTVDLPGNRNHARCYFIADGREDPYGVKKYETGSARHLKALHLEPFWAGAQRNRDAVGLVIYRGDDLKGSEVTNLQSHFVLRRNVDGFWLRGRPLSIPEGNAQQPGRVAVEPGDPLVLRLGTAGVAVRLLWARSQDGSPAAAALVNDGNPYGALRLTVEHRSANASTEAGAAFWVRIGTGLDGTEALEKWRTRFEQAAPAAVEASDQRVRIEVPGEDGPVAVAAAGPYGLGGQVRLQPEPARGALRLDGREVGRPILEAVEPVLSCRNSLTLSKPLEVPAQRAVYWEAEYGLVFPGMLVAEDAQASDKRYVWQPLDLQVSRLPGSVIWPLRAAQAGHYYLWARVLAADEQSNSFYVMISSEDGTLVPRTTWSIKRDNQWRWQRVSLDKAKTPSPLHLPAGLSLLQFRLREPGAKLDRLFLSADPKQQPGPAADNTSTKPEPKLLCGCT